MDVLGEFVTGWCIEDSKGSIGASHLYGVYKTWAEDGREYVMSQTMFGRQLADRGYDKQRCTKSGRIVWKGLRVRTSDDDQCESTPPKSSYREPEAGMGVTEVGDLLDEIVAAEGSEQFEANSRITPHEEAILQKTRIGPQTVQTLQDGAPSVHAVVASDNLVDGTSPSPLTLAVSQELSSDAVGYRSQSQRTRANYTTQSSLEIEEAKRRYRRITSPRPVVGRETFPRKTERPRLRSGGAGVIAVAGHR